MGFAGEDKYFSGQKDRVWMFVAWVKSWAGKFKIQGLCTAFLFIFINPSIIAEGLSLVKDKTPCDLYVKSDSKKII